MEIKRLRRSTDLLIGKAPFMRLVREISQSVGYYRCVPKLQAAMRLQCSCNAYAYALHQTIAANGPVLAKLRENRGIHFAIAHSRPPHVCHQLSGTL